VVPVRVFKRSTAVAALVDLMECAFYPGHYQNMYAWQLASLTRVAKHTPS
jgi:hypothetical protein